MERKEASTATEQLEGSAGTRVYKKESDMKVIRLVIICFFVVSQAAYAGTNDNLGSHNGLKIIVGKFTDKTGGTSNFRPEFGAALSEMMTTALVRTNRFIVLDKETIKAIEEAGGQAPRADLLVTGAITAFAADASRVDVPDKLKKKLKGKLKGFLSTTKVAMDLRLINLGTGQIVAATNVKGSASKFKGSVALENGELSRELNVFHKTPMETAIRKMIDKAVDFTLRKRGQ